MLISITQRGYVRRSAADAYRAQRSGRGVTGHATREEDEVLILFPARTLDTILFFSDRGKVYSEKAYQIPDAARAAKGVAIGNILSLESGERITAAVAVPDFSAAEYCSMATRRGRVKRLALSEFASVRPSGLIAITLEEDDELGWVRLTRGKDEIILVTEAGKALRFSETAIRPMGRAAGGVTGIALQKGDFVAGMEVVEPDGELLVMTRCGYGKRTPLADYPAKGRATGGVATIDQRSLKKTGSITVVRVVKEGDDLTLISANGMVVRKRIADIPRSGRATRGSVLIKLQEGDSLASAARISAADLREVGAGEMEQESRSRSEASEGRGDALSDQQAEGAQ